MEGLSSYLCMVTVPHVMVGLERMLDYRGVGLARFHCNDGCISKCGQIVDEVGLYSDYQCKCSCIVLVGRVLIHLTFHL